MFFNFLWKPKYSVWLKTGGCISLRVAVLADMHQTILTSQSVFHWLPLILQERAWENLLGKK